MYKFLFSMASFSGLRAWPHRHSATVPTLGPHAARVVLHYRTARSPDIRITPKHILPMPWLKTLTQ